MFTPSPRRSTSRFPAVRRMSSSQWINFWGSNHQPEITGPRSGSNLPSVRLLEPLKPGRVEPSDLILDPNYHPGRPQLDVGADLSLQGISRRPPAAAAAASPGLTGTKFLRRTQLPTSPRFFDNLRPGPIYLHARPHHNDW